MMTQCADIRARDGLGAGRSSAFGLALAQPRAQNLEPDQLLKLKIPVVAGKGSASWQKGGET